MRSMFFNLVAIVHTAFARNDTWDRAGLDAIKDAHPRDLVVFGMVAVSSVY